MSQTDWDTVVLGVGGVGSAALYHCARQGQSVLGIEQFSVGHAQGSSHGETRAIRMAYFEHPAYVPMLREAYTQWDELAAKTGQHLFHRTGILQMGPANGAVIEGVRRSALEHDLAVETLSAPEIRDRFADFTVPDQAVGLFEHNAGYLEVEACIAAHVACARQHGAALFEHTAVKQWHAAHGGVVVETTQGTVTARRLIITAGAWTTSFLPHLPLQILRKTLHWYATKTPQAYTDAPVFLMEEPGGVFYGFPQKNGAIKVAEHSGGHAVQTPAHLHRQITGADRQSLQGFLERWLPHVDPKQPLREAVCMYTMSPDGHFRIGTHPQHPNVRYVAGLSGHGFKFASVLGAMLAADVLINPLRSMNDHGCDHA